MFSLTSLPFLKIFSIGRKKSRTDCSKSLFRGKILPLLLHRTHFRVVPYKFKHIFRYFGPETKKTYLSFPHNAGRKCGRIPPGKSWFGRRTLCSIYCNAPSHSFRKKENQKSKIISSFCRICNNYETVGRFACFKIDRARLLDWGQKCDLQT